MQSDSLALVSIEDMFIFYNENDHAFQYALTDSRAKTVAIGSAVRGWRPNSASLDDAWSLTGMGIFSLCAIHMWRCDLDFTYYDVGANIGMTTIAQAIFFRRCGYNNRTIAFEPGPVHYALSQSIAINELDDAITLHKAAVSDVSGELTFHITPEQSPASSLLSAAVKREGVSTTKPVHVLSVRLDDIISSQEARHALVKIDAEGADFRVLEGLANTMVQRLAVIEIEFFPSLVETYTDPVGRLIEIAENFEIFEIEMNYIIPISPDRNAVEIMISKTKQRPMPATDLLFLPKALPNLDTIRNRLMSNR